MVRCVIGWKQILQAGLFVFLVSGGVAQAQDVRSLLVKMTVNVLTQKGFSRSAKLVNAVKRSLEKLSLDPYLSTDGMIVLSQQHAAMLAADKEFLKLLSTTTEPVAKNVPSHVDHMPVAAAQIPQTYAVQTEIPVRSQHLMQTVDKLAHVPVAGYGPLFSKINRTMFSDKYGMDLHRMIALHKTLYPQDKEIFSSREMERVLGLEKKAFDWIANSTSSVDWQKLSEVDQTIIFESFLPAYLLNPGEEIKEISVPLLAQALQYYREMVGGKIASKTGEVDYFAQQMSAITNLGLLGRMEDVPLLLEAAQQDFGLLNEWADYFLARAVFNLGTYEDVRTLSRIRLKMARERGELMPPVWQDIRELGSKEGHTLRVPQDEIETKEISIPPFLQEKLLLYHAFNYLLVNPTEKVTLAWKELRAGLVESFQPWLTSADKLARITMATARTPVVKPVENTAKPVEAFHANNPAKENPLAADVEHKTQRASLSTPRERPVKPTPRTSAPRKKESPERTKPVQKRSPVRSGVSYKKQPLSDMSVQDVMTALEDYVWEHQAAPDFNSELRHQVNRLRPQAAEGDPVCQQIVELMDSYSSKVAGHNSHQLYNELQRYIERYGKLPPQGMRLRNRVDRIWQKSKETDTWSQSIITIVDQYISRHFISSAKLLEDLQKHLFEEGEYPKKGTLLYTRIQNFRSKHSDDSNVPEMDRLFKQYNRPVDPARLRREIEAYLKEHGGFLSRPLHSKINLVRQWNPEDPDLQAIDELVEQAHQTKYDNILSELRAYIQKYKALPPAHSPFRQRINSIRRRGDPANETIQQINTLLGTRTKRSGRTPKQIAEELATYVEEYEEMPPHGTSLRSAVQNLLSSYKDDKVSPYVKQVREIKEQYRQKAKRTSAQLLQRVENYLAVHAQLPPSSSPLSEDITRAIEKGNPIDSDIRLLRQIVQEPAPNSPRTPQNVLRELQIYLEAHEGQLPSWRSGLGAAMYRLTRPGHPEDSVIEQIEVLVKEHAQHRIWSAQRVYNELQEYVLKYGQLPHAHTALRRAAYRIIKQETEDPEIRQAIQNLLKGEKPAPISQ